MTTPKKNPIQALPREPLTRKRRAAIHKYAHCQGERKGAYAHWMIDWVLKAERMKAAHLYAWLEAKGYRWHNDGWYLATSAAVRRMK